MFVYLSLLAIAIFLIWAWRVYASSKIIVYQAFSSIRGNFRSARVELRVPGTTAAHQHNGRLRNSTVDFIYDFCRANSLRPYWISPRMKYVRPEAACSRVALRYEDEIDSRIDTVLKNDCFILFDVDYYLTPSDFTYYASLFKPFLLFTFSPDSACGLDAEVRYNCCPDQEVHVKYADGGSYHHRLWNYDHEYVSFVRYGRHYLFNVEKKRLSPTREVILLIPKQHRYIMPMWKPPCLLQYRVLFVSGFQAQIIATSDDVKLHLAAPDSYDCLKISVGVVETCRVRLRNMKTPLASMVETHIKGSADNHVRYACLLFEYLLLNNVPSEMDIVLGYNSIVDTTLEPNDSHRLAHPPIDPNGNAPMRSPANDNWCLNDRLYAVRSDAQFPDVLLSQLDDFVSLFVRLDPVDLEIVAQRQARPTQRYLRDAVGPVFGDAPFKIKSFQKNESYPKAKAPRNITTVDAGFKTRYSAYTYALAEYCERFDWYGSGKTPPQIAARIQALSRVCELSEADYAKFDGTKSPAAVRLERAILAKCFPDTDCLDLYNQQINAVGVTSHGIRYDVGTSRLSGSPETTVLNSIINAFIAYCALECFDFIVAGDDLIATSLGPIKAIAASMGYVLETVDRPRYPTFLGRVYHSLPESSNSIYDVRRFVPKMHVIVASRSVPLHIAISRRAQGYLKTDPNTPIVSDWCRAMLKRYGTHKTCKHDRDIELPYDHGLGSYPVDEHEDLTHVVCGLLCKSFEYVQDLIGNFAMADLKRYYSMEELIIPPGVCVNGVNGPPVILSNSNTRQRCPRNGKTRIDRSAAQAAQSSVTE